MSQLIDLLIENPLFKKEALEKGQEMQLMQQLLKGEIGGQSYEFARVLGLIIENVPNKRVKIETPDGNILAYDMSEVEKMTKGPGDMSNIEPRVRGINKDGDEIRSTHLVQRQ